MKKPSLTAGKAIARSLLLSCFSLLIVACSGDSQSDAIPSFQYQPPAQKSDGWVVEDARDTLIDVTSLEQLTDEINRETFGYRFIDGLLIAQHGRLVYHKNFRTEFNFADRWTDNRSLDVHILNSVTKSYMATLVGIAIDQGIIANTEIPVHDYFPEHVPIANWTSSKASVQLHHWLTMQHGYQWDEWSTGYFESTNQNNRMNNADDPMQFLLDTEMSEQPGTVFSYSTGVTFGLGRLLENASGMSVESYMQQYLLEPLNIQQYDGWYLDDTLHMGSGLYLDIRDMAKLGQVYLDDGTWNGRPIVSPQWIERATTQWVQSEKWGYGYQWWMTEFSVGGERYPCYYADGLGGQYIFVIPSLSAVIAFTGSAYNDEEIEQRDIRQLVEAYLIPALEPSK